MPGVDEHRDIGATLSLGQPSRLLPKLDMSGRILSDPDQADPRIPAEAIPRADCTVPREFGRFDGPLGAVESMAQLTLHVQVPGRPPADPEGAGYREGEWAGCLAAFDAWAGVDERLADEGVDRCPLRPYGAARRSVLRPVRPRDRYASTSPTASASLVQAQPSMPKYDRTLRLTGAMKQRDVLLVGVTVLVCAAVFGPLTLAGNGHSNRVFTIPGNQARFARMDWICRYEGAIAAQQIPATVLCRRESTWRGLRLILTGDDMGVFSCSSPSSCHAIFRRPRSP